MVLMLGGWWSTLLPTQWELAPVYVGAQPATCHPAAERLHPADIEPASDRHHNITVWSRALTCHGVWVHDGDIPKQAPAARRP